ncbi:MAG: hypothetical protein HY428_02305 [Candidatus Levybacteria bacterium]|nr:hypothetical protein [Candidatus Levybacteria bacterium]
MRRNEQTLYRAFHGQPEAHQSQRDRRMVKEAVTLITDQLSELRGKEGTVIYPRELHPRDMHSLRGHRSGIGSRLGFMVSIPLEEGVGTLIEIKARRS